MFAVKMPPLPVMVVSAALLGAVGLYGWAHRGKTVSQGWEVRSPLPADSGVARAVGDVVSLGNLDRGLMLVGGMTVVLLVVRPRAAWVPFVAFGSTGVLVSLVAKPLFDHALNDGLGYPSGHSSVLVSAAVGFAVLTRGRAGALSATAGTLAATLPVAVWLGNYHRLSEVIAGAATGAAVGWLCAAAAN